MLLLSNHSILPSSDDRLPLAAAAFDLVLVYVRSTIDLRKHIASHTVSCPISNINLDMSVLTLVKTSSVRIVQEFK